MWIDWWIAYCVYWHFVAPSQTAALISGVGSYCEHELQ